ncbi:MAG TPA: ATP-binding protein, partial [Aquabacterium sp.]|nr:ATP-binding protein [Aquabacterium sp.]
LGLAQIGYQDPYHPTRRLFGQILESGQVLLGVVNDILDFSKIEAGKLHIELLPVEIRELIERVVAQVRDRAQLKQLQLNVRIDASIPLYVETDPLRLEQVLLNLLTNAIKFTQIGSVTIDVRRDGKDLKLTIEDTGIGMDSQQVAGLFSPFTQADSSTTRRFGGTGLGLSISKRLIELLGGRIHVASAPGAGSRFEITLPLSESAAAPPSAEGLSATLPARSRLGRLQGIRVLAAEDNRVNQIVLREFLALEGATATLVNGGQEAIDLIKSSPAGFDVVLMDVQMPEMDGYEATRRLKQLAPNLPIIGQTAHAMAEEQAKCKAAGMVDMVVKPLELDRLVEAILKQARQT